ncbi:hypothetical protein [Nonomuraea sp. NPDC001023]|uniref:hypothetical protein n=1 Tax=unclassified Nonomuraea TaxID=2593643 RepID=UPI003328BDC4
MTITSEPQTGVTPEIDRRTAFIASLRSLANLLEDIPEAPAPVSKEIRIGVLGSDGEAVPVIKGLCAALTDESVTYEATDDPRHALAVNVPLAGGFTARFVHVYDRPMTEYAARSSYASVIQVDADQAEAVA